MIKQLKTLKFPFIDHNHELLIGDELKTYLEELKKDHLFDKLSYILKEMTGNANKANMKRIYFDVNELNIGSNDDYEKGIKDFKEELSKNYERFSKIAEHEGYFVRIDFYTSKGFLIVSASNNTTILPIEKERIVDKIRNSAQFKSFEDALNHGFDSKEGAGFGIILSLMMLRKLGLNEKYFRIIDKDKYTQMQVVIPLSLLTEEEGTRIAKAVIHEIDEIPQFPQHIMDLQLILNNPNANFKSISHIVKKDPLLIADLLKIANSAFYMLSHKVDSIEEAVRLIGFKGIRNLVVTYAARKMLLSHYKLNVIEEIMQHSYEVAYYAYEMAKKLKLKHIIDDVYLAGILHDLGKIIANSLKPGLLRKIRKIANIKGVSREIVENLTSGYNHSIIGAELAKKWNFPENLVMTIQNHHIPLESNDESKDLSYIIYLADTIYYYKRDNYEFDFINYQVLKNYGFNNKEEFDKIVDYITVTFEERKKSIV